MIAGTKVIMSSQLKQKLIKNNCLGHVKEFGKCVGFVIGLTDYGSQKGPEVDVRWEPSGLRYAYDPVMLMVVT